MSTAPQAVKAAPASTLAASADVSPSPRICVECGGKFLPPAKGPGQHKKFCDAKGKGVCRTTFANREKAQGALVVTLLKVHALTRHSKDPRARALCGDVRTEMQRVVRLILEPDQKSGRAARLPDYVRGLVNVDNSYAERRRPR